MKKIYYILLACFIFSVSVNTLQAETSAYKANSSGKISDTAVVDTKEPALLIDTGGPSFIRGDKFVGETDPNLTPPKNQSNDFNMFILGSIFVLLLTIAYILLRTLKKSKSANIASVVVLLIIIIVSIFFIYTKGVNAFTPLGSTSCALNGQTYSSWESLTESVASSGYCTGGSGYSTGGSSNRPSSYTWKCTGWNGSSYVVTDSCSVSVVAGGSSSNGGSSSSCN